MLGVCITDFVGRDSHLLEHRGCTPPRLKTADAAGVQQSLPDVRNDVSDVMKLDGRFRSVHIRIERGE